MAERFNDKANRERQEKFERFFIRAASETDPVKRKYWYERAAKLSWNGLYENEPPTSA